MLSNAPGNRYTKAYLYHGFLSAEEAAHLIKIGEPHLKRSTVVGRVVALPVVGLIYMDTG